MKVAIHQPNFLPWIGYFQKISQVDKFVLFNDVQFERGKTFTSRTKILIQGKESWLTIPTMNKSNLKNIKDIKVDSNFIWKRKQLRTISLSYKKTPFFDEIFNIIDNVYSQKSKYLVDYNIPLIIRISNYLGLNTEFVSSSEIESYDKTPEGLDKIFEILNSVNATEYLSGGGAGSRRYIDEKQFANSNIQLKWQKIKFKSYKQLKTDCFIPGLSIVDLLFNKGKNAISYL